MLIVYIFCEIDDFCKFLVTTDLKKLIQPRMQRIRKRRLTLSEILSIQVFFHYSGAKNFKDFYTKTHTDFLKSNFPQLVSYTRFLELKNEATFFMALFAKYKNQNKSTGVSYIDSTALKVSHVKRSGSHKTFKNFAKKGMTSMGWFYGFKLHVVINHKGEILDFEITAGNVSDGNKDLIDRLTNNVKGVLVADKGYIGRAKDLLKKGIKLLHKPRSNMKKVPIDPIEAALLKSRALIESVFGVLKNTFSLEHSRHRSILGGIIHIASTLAAYALKPSKPSIKRSDPIMSLIA